MWFQRMAAKQKKAPTRGVETEDSTAPETAVTHMGDENGCGVRRKLIGLQLNVGRSDAQHKSADYSGPTDSSGRVSITSSKRRHAKLVPIWPPHRRILALGITYAMRCPV